MATPASASPERSPAQSETDESAPLKGRDGARSGGSVGGAGEDVVLDHGIRLRFGADDTLVVTGLPRKRNTSICGLGSAASPDITIPFYNLLWAEHADEALVLDYVAVVPPPSPKTPAPPTPFSSDPTPSLHQLPPNANVRVQALRLACTSLSGELAERLAESLLTRAYPARSGATRRMRAMVLVNPNAGQGKADAIWRDQVAPILRAARMRLEVVRTQYRGHGADVVAAETDSVVLVPRAAQGDGKEEGKADSVDVRRFDVDATDAVICLSGDGMPYEVFNGLGRRSDARRALAAVAVAHVPCGSGNGMCANLYGTSRPSAAALAVVKARRVPMDLASVTFAPYDDDAADQGGQQQQQPPRRVLSFLSQALGIVADSDLGTEDMRWLGQPRFLLGFLSRLFGRTCYPADVAVKVEVEGKDAIRAHYAAEKARELERLRMRQQPQKDAAGGAGGKSIADQSERSGSVAAGSSEEDPAAKAVTEGVDGMGVLGARHDGSDDALPFPPLRFGTVKDDLPEGWTMVPYENLGNFYCGNMSYMATDANFFSAACINDGLLDLVTVDGDISPVKAIQMMTSVDTDAFFDNPLITYRKISAYRVIPRQPKGFIAVDGEKMPYGAFQAEVHRGLGTVLSTNTWYLARGPRAWESM